MSVTDGMRQDQWQNTVTIADEPWGVWDTFGGGEVEQAETKYKPGGMAAEVSLGGTASIGNLTLGRLLTRDQWPTMRRLMARLAAHEVIETSVARQPLDRQGNPFDEPLIYGGKLQRVTPGDTDSNSSDAQVWEIVVSTDGTLG